MRTTVNALDLLSRPFDLAAYEAQRTEISLMVSRAPTWTHVVGIAPRSAPLDHLFVAGLGRCGTTMVMNMLARGGAPMTGRAPAYEVEDTWAASPHLASWLAANRGRAVKWIDPTASPMPAGTLGKTILLSRHAREQARSVFKMAGKIPNRNALRAAARRIVSDQEKALKIVRTHGPVLRMSFEDILEHPSRAAEMIRDFVRPEWALDPDRMASAVIPRDPTCAPDLAIEARLLREADHG